jgi:hypothetical protein
MMQVVTERNQNMTFSIPLLPDAVQAMRLVRAYVEAFGLNQDELLYGVHKESRKVWVSLARRTARVRRKHLDTSLQRQERRPAT